MSDKFFDKVLGFTPEQWKANCRLLGVELDIDGLFAQCEFVRTSALCMPWNGVQKWAGYDYMEDAFKVYRRVLEGELDAIGQAKPA